MSFILSVLIWGLVLCQIIVLILISFLYREVLREDKRSENDRQERKAALRALLPDQPGPEEVFDLVVQAVETGEPVHSQWDGVAIVIQRTGNKEHPEQISVRRDDSA